MLKIKLSLFIFLFSFLSLFSQEENINNYKYVIVPEQFDFQKGKDSHQINSLTKFLFNKNNFTVFLSSETLPLDLRINKCLALTTRMNNNSGMFGKKIDFELVNCNDIVVFSSRSGTSKEKEFKKAFHQAIRKSFESLRTINYKYVEDNDFVKSTPDSKVDLVLMDVKVIPEIKTISKNSTLIEESEQVDFLTAVEEKNGFKLVNESDNLLYKIQETSVKNIYIIKGIDGIIFKSKDKWFLEYYSENKFFKEELKIKF